MTSSTPKNLNYTFNFQNYFNGGWHLMNRSFGNFVGITFLFFLITIVIGLLPVINIFGNLFNLVFMAGYFVYCRNLKSNNAQFSQFFDGFKFFGHILLFVLTLVVFFLPFLVVFFGIIFPFDYIIEFINNGFAPMQLGEAMGNKVASNLTLFLISIFAFTLVWIYLMISYTFTIPLIVDQKMGFWQAMETSRKTVGKNFFHFFVWYFLVSIVVAVGALISLGVGLLILIPLIYCVIFEAYDQIFFQTQNEIKEI